VTVPTQPAPVRAPGRPRDPHVEAAIVQATLELIDEGEPRPDVGLEDLIDTLVGPVMYGVLVGGSARVQGRAYVEHIVDLVLQGAATPTG
jgi:hypothetical protein